MTESNSKETCVEKHNKNLRKFNTPKSPVAPFSINIVAGHRKDVAYILRLFSLPSFAAQIKIVLMLDYSSHPLNPSNVRFSQVVPKDEKSTLLDPKKIVFVQPNHQILIRNGTLIAKKAPKKNLNEGLFSQSLQALHKAKQLVVNHLIILSSEPSKVLDALLEPTIVDADHILIESEKTRPGNNANLITQAQCLSRGELLNQFKSKNHYREAIQYRKPIQSTISTPRMKLESGHYRRLINWLNKHQRFDFSAFRHSWLASIVKTRRSILGHTDTAQYLAYCATNLGEHREFKKNLLPPITESIHLNALYQQLLQSFKRQNNLGRVNPQSKFRIWVLDNDRCETTYLVALAATNLLLETGNTTHLNIEVLSTQFMGNSDQTRFKERGLSKKQLKTLGADMEKSSWVTSYDAGSGNLKNLDTLIEFASYPLEGAVPSQAFDFIVCKQMFKLLKLKRLEKLLGIFYRALATQGAIIVDPVDALPMDTLGFKPVNEYLYERCEIQEAFMGSAEKSSSRKLLNDTLPTVTTLMQCHESINRTNWSKDVLLAMANTINPCGFLMSEGGNLAHIFGEPWDELPFFFNRRAADKSHLGFSNHDLKHKILSKVYECLGSKQSKEYKMSTLLGFINQPKYEYRVQFIYYEPQTAQRFCAVFFQ